MFFVYVLKCSDGSYYTGHTENLAIRLAQHNQRYSPSCYTFNRLPIELIFQQAHVTRAEALAAERQTKGWSRKKKEAMMKGDWAEVSRFSRNETADASSNNLRVLRQAQDEREA